MSQLVEIVQRPHPTGSLEHRRVREYLVGRLRSLGLDPEIQTRTLVDTESGSIRAATVRNVLARIPGTASTGSVALVAHYDASPLSPGAGDGGVGVAAILEAARALVSGEPLRNDLILVLSDGEELGLLGARAFAESHPWMGEVGLVISSGMRGVSGPSFFVEENSHNDHLVRILAEATPRSAGTSLARLITPNEPFGFELTPFLDRGATGISLVALGGREYHQQPTEKAETVSERTLQHHGLQLLALAREFGNQDLAGGFDAGVSSRVYFSLPFFGLIHHPLDWTFLVSLILLAGWVVVGAFARLRGSLYQGALAGLALSGGLILGGYGLGWGLLEVLRTFHPEYGLLETAFHDDGTLSFALATLVVGISTAGYALARRWFAMVDIFLGALGIPLGVATWLGIAHPAGSVALHWPLGGSLLLAGLLIAMGPTRRRNRWRWLTVLVLTAAILSILVPSLELISVVFTFREAPLLGAAMTLGCLLVLPALEWLSRPRAWWLPALSITVAGVLVVVSSPWAREASTHPTPTALVLLVDDTLTVSVERQDSPMPVADTLRFEPDSLAVRRVAGRWISVPGPGEVWARSWVPEGEALSSGAGVLLLPREDEYQVIGAGPETHLPKPRIRVLGDSIVGGVRHLSIALRSNLNGEVVGLHIPAGSGVITRLAEAARESDQESLSVQRLTHWGEPEGGVVTFGILTRSELDSLEIEVFEHHLRPWEILGEGFFRRDESLIPNPQVGSDRIIQRTRVVVPLQGEG